MSGDESVGQLLEQPWEKWTLLVAAWHRPVSGHAPGGRYDEVWRKADERRRKMCRSSCRPVAEIRQLRYAEPPLAKPVDKTKRGDWPGLREMQTGFSRPPGISSKSAMAIAVGDI